MNSKRMIVAAAVVAAAIGVTGCGMEEKPAKVVEKKSTPTPAAPTVTVTTEPEPSTDIVVEEPEETESDIPMVPTDLVLGDTVQVADWEVTVTKVVKDASGLIADTNMFNDPPRVQYVLVTYTAKYLGSERTGDPSMDLTWTVSTPNGVVHDESYQVTPADDEEWPEETRRGGTLKVQVAFDLNPNGAVLSVEGYDENFDVEYADFPL